MEQGWMGKGVEISQKNQRYVFISLQLSVFSTVIWLVFLVLKVIKCLVVAVCLEWSCFDWAYLRKMSWKLSESKDVQEPG